jgi:hypothetical protein
MADEKKTYLINFEDNLAVYAQHAADAKAQVDALTAANKALASSGEANEAQIQENAAALRVAQQEYRNAQKNVELATKANVAQKNSYEELYRRWQLAQTQLKLLGDGFIRLKDGTVKVNEAYVKQAKVVADAKKALNDFGTNINDGRLGVGLYGQALQGFSNSLAGMKDQLVGMVKNFSLVGTAVSAAIALLNKLKDAFAATETGWKTFNTYGQITKQIMYDLATTFQINYESLAKLQEVTELQNKIRQGDRDDLIVIAKLERELADLRFKAADQTLLSAERLEYLNKAMAKHNELVDYKINDAYEELQAIEKLLALRPEDTKLLDQQAQKIAQIIDLDRSRTEETRRMESQRTGFLKEEQDRLVKIHEGLQKAADEEIEMAKKKEEELAKVRKKAAEDAEREIKKNHANILKWHEDAWKKLVEQEKRQNSFKEDLLKLYGIREQDLTIQKNQELYDTIKKQADILNQKEIDDAAAKEQTILEVKQAALQGVQQGADAAFESSRNRLQAQMQAELSNANLTAAQKVAIQRKYYKQQQKLDVTQAIINGALAIGNALATTKPFVPAGLIAAGTAAVTTAAQVAVIKSQKFDGGGGGGGGATAITASPAMTRILATPAGAQTLTQNVSPAAAAAGNYANLLSAGDIAKAVAAMPAPIVTVEDINARAAEKQKVEVRATI